MERIAQRDRPAEPEHPTPGAAGHDTAGATAADARAVDGAHRLAVIDVGSNSLRLIVAEATRDGAIRVLDDEKVVTRLAHGLVEHGLLDEETMRRAAEAIARFRTIAEGYRVDRIDVIATAAVREATNGAAFVQLVEEAAGLTPRIISAEDEARLAFRSVSHAFDLGGIRTAVADIGGGSTEVLLSSGTVIEQIYTLPLGAVRLTERFDLAEEITTERYRAMRRHVRSVIRDHIGKLPLLPQVLYGTGGTFTTVAAIHLLRRSSGHASDLVPLNVRGCELQHSVVRHLTEDLRKMPLAVRSRVTGLNPDRADIIVAGLSIVDQLLRYMGVNVLRVHDQGIRTGYLISMIADRWPDTGQSPVSSGDRMSSVRRFSAACRSDPEHVRHVAWLAMRLFDQFIEVLEAGGESWTSAEGRDLLQGAAMMYDVGYYINYSKYHKHSYHLIVHADLAGFDHREIELIANIARYHRRARPRRKHRNFDKLSEGDQAIVLHLAAILRLAVGLDRSRGQRVRDVRVELRSGLLCVDVVADEEPVVDLWGAERKAALFERVFDREVRFTFVASSEPVQGEAPPPEGSTERTPERPPERSS